MIDINVDDIQHLKNLIRMNKIVTLSITSSMNMLCSLVFYSLNNDRDFLLFCRISIRVDLQLIYAFILSDVILNVVESVRILMFIESERICIFETQFLTSRSSLE